jgi:hypothetical protein
MSVLLVLAVLGGGHAASAATASPTPGELLAVDVCSCCPATCGGGTLIGCYHTIDMPPNAVTCVYTKAGTKAFACVSCLLASTDIDATTAAYNAIFGDAGSTCPKTAE